MVWIESTAGCSCPAGCSKVGFRQETKVRHVVEIIHVHLAEVISGLRKADLITSAVLGSAISLLRIHGGSLRCFLHAGWVIHTPRNVMLLFGVKAEYHSG